MCEFNVRVASLGAMSAVWPMAAAFAATTTARLRPRYRIRLRTFEAICRMVGQGIGVGVVPRSAGVRCRRAAGVKAMRLDDV